MLAFLASLSLTYLHLDSPLHLVLLYSKAIKIFLYLAARIISWLRPILFSMLLPFFKKSLSSRPHLRFLIELIIMFKDYLRPRLLTLVATIALLMTLYEYSRVKLSDENKRRINWHYRSFVNSLILMDLTMLLYFTGRPIYFRNCPPPSWVFK